MTISEMTYKTYIISLKDEFSRRQSIKQQLERLDESYFIVDAVDFRRSPSNVVKENLSFDLSSSIERLMTKGEVGCALSHLTCYKEFVSTDHEWAWIVEDDADLERLNPGTIWKLLESVAEYDVDVIILGYSKLYKDKEKDFYKMEPLKTLWKSGELYIGTPWRNWTCGTVSYLIRKTGAEKMLNHMSDGKVFTVADDWRFFHKYFNLKIAHCRPLLVFEDFTVFKSSLEQDRALESKQKFVIFDTVRIIRGFVRGMLMRVF